MTWRLQADVIFRVLHRTRNMHIHAGLTDRIIFCYYKVREQLLPGLPESAYRNALAIECRRAGLTTSREVAYAITYANEVVGLLRADLIINGLVIVEAKHVDRLVQAHRDQVFGYLRISGLAVGLVLNFGLRAEVRRVELFPGERANDGSSLSEPATAANSNDGQQQQRRPRGGAKTARKP